MSYKTSSSPSPGKGSFPELLDLNPSDESSSIKAVFQVTVDPNESRYTFLKNLSSQLSVISNIALSFNAPVQTNSPQANAIANALSSALSNLLPSATPPMQIPSRPDAQMASPKLDRTLLSTITQERLLLSGSITQGGKWLLESFERANLLARKEGEAASKPDAISNVLKQHILKSCKELLIAECVRRARARDHNYAELSAFVDMLPSDFLSQIVAMCDENELFAVFAPIFTHLAFEMRESTRGKNLLEGGHHSPLRRLSALSQDANLLKVFASILSQDLKTISTSTAREIENGAALAGFLCATTILSPYDKSAFAYSQLLPNFPNASRSEIQLLQNNLRQTLKVPIEAVQAILKKIFLMKEYKEVALSWISSILQLNDARPTISPTDQLAPELNMMVSSDGFVMNLVSLLLEFCKPFMDPSAGLKVAMINASYPRLSHRLDMSKYPKLAPPAADAGILGAPEETPQFNFISEMFFLCYSAIHVGLMPVIQHYTNTLTALNQNKTAVEQMKKQFGDSWAGTPQGEKVAASEKRIYEFIEGFETQLLDPAFVQKLFQFCQLSISWMLSMKDKDGLNITPEMKRNFASFPEFFVRDVADLINLYVRIQPSVLLNGSSPPLIHLAIDWVVMLLNLPSLVKNPIVRAKLVQVLSEIVNKKRSEEVRITKAGWGSISPEAIQYSTVFQENKEAQLHLAAGLMIIYNDVDIVEGLDVDKENFDKYSVRRNISFLLNDLWQIPAFKVSFKRESGSDYFAKFLGTVLNDSIHLLEDSLGRLIDIKQLQIAMADTNEWDHQDPEIKKERERYYSIQENSARGFLSLANSILDILGYLTSEKDVVPVFLRPGTIERVAAMLNHFFGALCGPKCNNLKVKNPEKYNFSPKDLLTKITNITLSFAPHQHFVETVARDLDYSPEIMQQAHQIMARGIVSADTCRNFLEFITRINAQIQANNQLLAQAESAGSDRPVAMELDMDEEELEQLYVAELEDKRFDTAAMMAPDSEKYLHHYASNIASSGSGALSGSRMQKIVKECQMLATSLPIARASSIFARSDEERMDVLKALITGPKDSPYSLGCFQFDIYFPPTYPLDPPLCNLETTGNGTVRFNPNLYNCGKVCLSLLGTWHGDASTKWNPTSSTLHQVLVSIQALILVEQPYFNEPAYEAQRGTKEGDMRSKEYNETIRLGTLRHAILGQLRAPSLGFEDVIKTHFRLQKDRVLTQCKEWLDDASPENAPKFERTFEDIKTELAKL
eukprot:TRINITY_DN2500_c0_g2_i1.p1 TRINITY_DN2500_c0_g2~~TRINITY_DN2500_c0_g2_i1.p1  ORF type:complete len:1245 (-),score=372.21 TRINITY_DN2500_c0_g2_i1:122-3856(-)